MSLLSPPSNFIPPFHKATNNTIHSSPSNISFSYIPYTLYISTHQSCILIPNEMSRTNGHYTYNYLILYSHPPLDRHLGPTAQTLS